LASPSHSDDNQQQPYSSGLTREAVTKAESLFGAAMEDAALQPMLAQLTQQTEELDESERRQLQEIASLLEESDAADGDEPSPLQAAGTFELSPSEDRMFLSLSVFPPIADGEPVKVDEVVQWLRDRNLTQGVDMRAIQQAVRDAANGDEVRDVVVVRGRHPGSARDGYVERFARNGNDDEPAPVTERGLERASEHPLFCREGDVVLRYHPPEPGQAGHDAYGNPIEPPAPVDVNVSAGRNVQAEGNDYVAEVSGVVVFGPEQVEVRKALILNKDVTRQSEKVDFDGEVHVRGAARSGASIKATGNIIVEGTAEAAEIVSQGDVVLRSGVAGRNRAVIRAGNDVIARFSENANLLAGQDIKLQVGALHSRMIAGRAVRADQGKGHITGGAAMAGDLVQVKQLGGRGGVTTHASVGISKKTMDMLGRIDELWAKVHQRKGSAAELADQMQRVVGDPRRLRSKERQTYAKLRELQLACDVQLRKLNHRRNELLTRSARNGQGEIKVQLSVMPKVQISIGRAELESDGDRGPWTFVFDDKSEKIVAHRRA
jgi:uncharacterized protein (DUF342 family)